MPPEHDEATAEHVDGKQILKLALDLGPLLIFFAAYLFAGIYWATGTLMVGMLVAVALSWAVLGHVSPTMLATTVLAEGFGAMTLWLHDPSFIKMKPTIVNLIFAAVLAVGLALGKSPLKLLLGEALRMTDEGWRRLTLRWVMFFVALAGINEVVWRMFSETAWATFKVFGMVPLTIAFFALQWPLIKSHALPSIDESNKSAK